MKEDKITIARLWPKYKGGYESRTSVIMGLDAQRYRTICIYLTKNSKQSNFFDEKGYKTFYVSNRQSLRTFNFLVIWNLAKVLKTEKVDIIHCHKHKSMVYGTIAAMIARTPVIIAHVHGLDRTRNWHRKLTNFFVMKRVNKILTVGEAVRGNVLKSNPRISPGKVYSLGNSIDYSRFANVSTTKESARRRLGLAPDSFVFGTVGRLVPTKGQIYLINAFAKVKQLVPSADLILVGDGRLRKQLGKQAAETLYTDSVHFLGYRDDIPELLKAMDVFVFPSVAEGLGRGLLEAMAAGVPCIGTNVGGVPEILADGKYGLLVPPEDDNALAEAMLRTAAMSQEEKADLTREARQRVTDEYDHQTIIRRLDNLYRNQVAAKQSFAEYIKHGINLVEIGNKYLPVEQLYAQYNPDRFEKYRSLHRGPVDTVLDMSASPHCRLLRAYQEDRKGFWSDIKKSDYYRMQRLYGKSRRRALSKAEGLIELYENIKSNGFNLEIIVVSKPIIENEYNSGYEIYEGHHRVACCLLLGIKSMLCRIVKVAPR